MKILSWNVNGIRAVVKKGFVKTLNKIRPDTICLQEVKIHDTQREKEKFDFKNYVEYWNSAKRPGYAGTAILLSDKLSSHVKSYTTGLGIKKFDDEGRTQTLEFKKLFLVNTYFPNSRRELTRLKFKMEYNNALSKYIKKLDKKKPVIICGDFNVAHQEIDIARPKDNVKNAGFTPQERKWATKFLESGFVDTYRYMNPKKVEYSWWSYRFKARERNIGWRIDYFLTSKRIKKYLKKAFILTKVLGSDHCPVGIKIEV